MTEQRPRRTRRVRRTRAPLGTRLLRIRLDLPDAASSVPLCRRLLRALLADLGVEARRAQEIELAMGEAAGNVVRHAYADPGHCFTVTLEFFVDRVRLQVADHGQGFRRADVPGPEEGRIGGWGLWLIEQLAGTATIRRRPGGGTLVKAEFPLPHPVALSPPGGCDRNA